MRATASHAIGSAAPHLCGEKNDRDTPRLHHRQNDKLRRKMTVVAAKVYTGTKQPPKLPSFWCGELRRATKHALYFPAEP